MDPVTIVAGVVVSVLVVWFFQFVIAGFIMDRKLRAIPSPSGAVPFLGHALQVIGKTPWNQFRDWCSGFGTICTFQLLNQRVVYTNEPKIIKRVLLTNQRNYNKDTKMSYKPFMCLLGNGLVTAEGEHWRKGRMLLSHALRIDILDEVPLIAINATRRLLKRFDNNKVIDLNEEYRHLTLQVITEAAVSCSPEEGDRIFARLYLPIVHECNRLVWAPYRAVMPWLKGYQEKSKCLAELNAIIDDLIRKRWAQRTKEAAEGITRKQDILDKTMCQLTEMPEPVVLQLRDDVKTMLLAGHETSAALLTWATYELMRNDDIRAHVVEEVEAIFGPHIRAGTIPTMEDVRKLRWVPAVLKESMRHHPPVPLTMRISMKDDVIPAEESGLGHAITIPKGCTVAIGIDGAHHREDLFPNAQKFLPQRFLDEAANDIDPYAYVPFINGPRNCLGQHLALTETQIVISYVIYHMNLSLPPGSRTIEKLGKHHDYIVPSVPQWGLEVQGKPRV